MLQAWYQLRNSLVLDFTQLIDGTGENELFGHINMHKYIRPITQMMQRTAYPPLKQATCLCTRKLLYSFEFLLQNLILFTQMHRHSNNN